MRDAETFSNKFRDLVHPEDPLNILLRPDSEDQYRHVTIDEVKQTFEKMLSHLDGSLTSPDLKRLSNLPCPDRVHYP